jgi:hypothetical protein
MAQTWEILAKLREGEPEWASIAAFNLTLGTNHNNRSKRFESDAGRALG